MRDIVTGTHTSSMELLHMLRIEVITVPILEFSPKKAIRRDSHEAVSTSHSRTETEDRNLVSAPFQVHPEKTASRSCRSPKLDVAFGSKNNGLL